MNQYAECMSQRWKYLVEISGVNFINWVHYFDPRAHMLNHGVSLTVNGVTFAWTNYEGHHQGDGGYLFFNTIEDAKDIIDSFNLDNVYINEIIHNLIEVNSAKFKTLPMNQASKEMSKNWLYVIEVTKGPYTRFAANVFNKLDIQPQGKLKVYSAEYAYCIIDGENRGLGMYLFFNELATAAYAMLKYAKQSLISTKRITSG